MRRTFIGAAIVPFAGALLLSVGVGPAAADSANRQIAPFTFISAADGHSVTCTVEAYAVVFGATDDAKRDAFSSLKGYGDDPSCKEGTATLTATYRNSSGVQVQSGAGGDRSVYWTADDVGPGSSVLSVEHQFAFSDCLSNCTLTLTTAPK